MLEMIIETENLYLAKPDFKYLDDLHHIHSDPQAYLYSPKAPHNHIEQTKSMLNDWLTHWENYGFGYFLMLTKNHELVGVCGFRYKKIVNENYLNLYYHINPKFMRNGYTKEACVSVINYLEMNGINDHIKMVALTKKDNQPSIKTALSLGFSYDSSFDNLEDEHNRYFFK